MVDLMDSILNEVLNRKTKNLEKFSTEIRLTAHVFICVLGNPHHRSVLVGSMIFRQHIDHPRGVVLSVCGASGTPVTLMKLI